MSDGGTGAIPARVTASRFQLVALTIAGLALVGCSTAELNPDPVHSRVVAAPRAWNSSDHGQAVARARLILSMWSRPDLPYQRWWAGLKGLLTPEARQSYAFTDPSQVPRLTIGGVPDESASVDPFVDTVYFETGSGRFGVDLSRASMDARWLGESIIFPGGESILQ